MMHCDQHPVRLLLVLLGFTLLAFGGPLSGQDLQELEEQAILAAVEKVGPSVVKIETLGGLERVGQVLVNTGPTTGLVVSADGYVISSAFNFIQQPSSILVTLPSGKRATAKIVARDHARMLVLLKVTAEETLPVPTAVPRGEIQTGQWAIAVGRTYDQPEPNLSVGVVSATNRIWGKAIQTDAKISPANYGGPLIDIQGRVLGVLVPLSPQGQGPNAQGGEIAGAEWYDSGIGFAVPLAEINPRLDTLKGGKDLHPGLLGISLKPGDIYALPAEIAACQAGSPGYKAGLKAGDTIVEIDGSAIVRQAQLRHALGSHYAGDKVQLVVARGKETTERITAEIELVDKLIPYETPFLGLLPMRGGEGVVVRYVYPGSPAGEAGIKAGDKVVALNDTAVTDATQLRNAVANLEPKSKANLKLDRGGEVVSVELMPTTLPTDIPAELPSPFSAEPPPADAKPATGLVEIKLPEETSQCVAYVPDNYHPARPHALVVMLPPPGPIDREKLVADWKDVCAARNLIVLAPMSAAKEKWQPTESAFVRKTIDNVTATYNVDPTRLVTYGYQAGGAMAFLVGFEHVDRVRGVCGIEAAPPPRAKVPDSDPIHRQAFYLASAEKSPVAAAVKAILEKLRAAKLPVTQKQLDQPRPLSAEEVTELGRWIDTLDRI